MLDLLASLGPPEVASLWSHPLSTGWPILSATRGYWTTDTVSYPSLLDDRYCQLPVVTGWPILSATRGYWMTDTVSYPSLLDDRYCQLPVVTGWPILSAARGYWMTDTVSYPLVTGWPILSATRGYWMTDIALRQPPVSNGRMVFNNARKLTLPRKSMHVQRLGRKGKTFFTHAHRVS